MRIKLPIEKIHELVPGYFQGATINMRADIELHERAVELFIHEAAEYYGEQWCKEMLDLNWEPPTDERGKDSE